MYDQNLLCLSTRRLAATITTAAFAPAAFAPAAFAFCPAFDDADGGASSFGASLNDSALTDSGSMMLCSARIANARAHITH